MKIYLVDLVKEGIERPIEIPEVGTISVGRSKLSDVVVGIDEETAFPLINSEESKYLKCVSREHCILHVEGSQPYVTDNNSKNGTFVNGERVESSTGTLIDHGDVLSLGPYGFQVFFHDRDSRIGIKNLKDSLPKTVPYEQKNLNPNEKEKQ